MMKLLRICMKAMTLIFIVLTAPLWVPFWLMGKYWRPFLALLFVSVLSGCVTNSGHFDKSPCTQSCHFYPANT